MRKVGSVMGEHERWNERLIRLRAWAREKMRPYPLTPAQPKHRRTGGPSLVPSDWYDPDKQRFLGKQCGQCHGNVPVGVELHGGLCGPCWLARAQHRRIVNGDDIPPAA